ncbi:glycerophosphodiester phosphodiesterase [Kitasatospora sp. NBC_01287]|uniref:glycerophosphodiester phosphodiesterase n=1 Tax=Kitasatospora sp. NBC_01287 TaxID=2903573 RepID=UPI00224FFD68|nr:glycerophosphodiester phosphodiesterase [Kitasatospora sp. NBC_01287]MCX4744661.1 glycerophosphodiester phosphodiesterase [Kitasatospora sp. NBC_01287]
MSRAVPSTPQAAVDAAPVPAGAGPRPLAVAHRGDPYRFRENTLPSVAAALAAGADAVEVDVRLTRDGVPMLLHDSTLKRLWGLDRPLHALTAEKLAAQRFEGGERVPTLAEALQLVAEHPSARLMIDLDDPAPAAAAWQAVSERRAADRVLFCGPATALLAVRALAPEVPLALTWERPGLPVAALLADLRPRYLNPPFGLVDQALVDRAAQAGLAVSTWTVDRRRTMRRMRAAGVASVTSNRIGLLRSVLDGRP